MSNFDIGTLLNFHPPRYVCENGRNSLLIVGAGQPVDVSDFTTGGQNVLGLSASLTQRQASHHLAEQVVREPLGA